MSVKGTIQVSGVHKSGETFMQDVACPFKAEVSNCSSYRGYIMVEIQLAVPQAQVDNVLAGLESGADLTLDGVPSPNN